jgi:hypothetical protein
LEVRVVQACKITASRSCRTRNLSSQLILSLCRRYLMPASSQACRRRQVRARQFRQDALPPGIGGEQNPDRSDDDSVPDLKPSALRPHRAAPGQVVSDGVEELIRNAGAGHGSSLYEGRRLPNHGGANLIPESFVRACQLPVPRGDLQVQDRTGVLETISLTHLCCCSYRACRVDAIPILVTTEGRRWSGRWANSDVS